MSEFNADAFKRNFLKILIALAIVLAFIYILTPFFIPILLGGILAMAFSPFLGYFTKKGWNRKVSLLIITLGLFLIGGVPISFVLIRETKVIASYLSQKKLVVTKLNLEEKVYTFLDHFSQDMKMDSVALREKFDNFMDSAGTYAFNLLSSFLSKVPEMLMFSLITILCFYFFLLEEEKLRKWFDHYFYFSKKNGDHFIALTKSSCKEIFFSNVVVGITQATTLASGAYFTDTGDFLFIFVITFFLSFIPTGASPVGFLLGILAFIDRRIGAGIAMVLVASFSGVIDNIVRSYLNTRGEVEVPIFVSFLAIIGGVYMMGLPGLFVGPLLASLTYRALPIILDEWFPESNTESNKR